MAIFSWEDIVSLIEQYKSVKEWYVYEKLQSFEPDIEILLNDQTSTKEAPIILNPEYTEQYVFFEYKPQSLFNPYSSIASFVPQDFCRKGSSVKLKFDIINNGDFLENCLFEVTLMESSTHKFCSSSLYEKINSPYLIEDYFMQTSKEFTLHSGYKKTVECYIEFAEEPIEEEFILECCFTSKQNKKPLSINLFVKSIPTITKMPNKKIPTHDPSLNNQYRIEIKPKESD